MFEMYAHMLVDEYNGDVFSFVCEAVKGVFNCRILSLGVHDQKVALRVWRFGNVLD